MNSGSAQSSSSKVSWTQQRDFPECDRKWLQSWLRWKDYFSTGVREGRECPTRVGVKESGQGRAVGSLPQRGEGRYSRGRAWECRVESWSEDASMMLTWLLCRITAVYMPVQRKYSRGGGNFEGFRKGEEEWVRCNLNRADAWQPGQRQKILLPKIYIERTPNCFGDIFLRDVNLSQSKTFDGSRLHLTRRLCY